MSFTAEPATQAVPAGNRLRHGAPGPGHPGFLPTVGPAVVLLGQLLSLRAGSLAVQEAEQLDSRRTIATISVTFAVAFLVSGAVRAFLANIGLWSALIDPLRGA